MAPVDACRDFCIITVMPRIADHPERRAAFAEAAIDTIGDLGIEALRLRDVAARADATTGALTHYSWALHDALRSYAGIAVEVHLSNPGAREGFRHVSVLAGVVAGTISGFGGLGYVVATDAVLRLGNR